jgi:uncharacterized protein (TIGR03435 family)
MLCLRQKLLCAIVTLLCAGLTEPIVIAQTSDTTAPPPAASTAPIYDILSIKLNKTASGNVDIDTNNDRFSATNVSLRQLLADIYDIRQDLISGIPDPVDSARFDVEAKISEPDPVALKQMTRQQGREMLLPLLTERFQLKVHTATQTLPVYDLVQTFCQPDRPRRWEHQHQRQPHPRPTQRPRPYDDISGQIAHRADPSHCHR